MRLLDRPGNVGGGAVGSPRFRAALTHPAAAGRRLQINTRLMRRV
ncbi:hypothetical protein I553_8562 [Mycobacterium xenopi 4042]|uniref:Uncharacterized protein n=1 Tax=Mycobacterium xenopi 4042 TaxID=1299334 RepID=X8CK77_MYCXE|nr:hypothetical protein I553_8562 [Mycobacterium xenopi 4042]